MDEQEVRPEQAGGELADLIATAIDERVGQELDARIRRLADEQALATLERFMGVIWQSANAQAAGRR